MEAIEKFWREEPLLAGGSFEQLLFDASSDDNAIQRKILDTWITMRGFTTLITAPPIDNRDYPRLAQLWNCTGFNTWDYPGVR